MDIRIQRVNVAQSKSLLGICDSLLASDFFESKSVILSQHVVCERKRLDRARSSGTGTVSYGVESLAGVPQSGVAA